MRPKLWTKFLELMKPDCEDDPVFEGDSQFHHIIIRDVGNRRTMYFGEHGEEAETSIDLANPLEPVFEYPGMMLTALALQPEGRRVALIGLGGGFIPALFQAHLPGHELTVVEVDLLVVELAQTYFGFDPVDNVRLVVDDGRDFLAGLPEGGLDQIWLDAFSGNYVPTRLSGLEFLSLCRSRLAPGGLLVQNLHQSQPRVFQDQLKTTEAAFGPFLAFDGQRCGNAIVVSRRPDDDPHPAWKPGELVTAAKQFGPRVGPYDLVEEMRKVKDFAVDPSAEIL